MLKYSVCIFGDSIARGVILDSITGRYTFAKDSFANLVSQTKQLTVDNFAKFGCTITKALDIVNKFKDNLKNYDYTILEFGGNDCDFNWSEISNSPDSEHICNTPIDAFVSEYSSLIEKVRTNGGTPILMTLPPIDSKKYFSWVSKKLNPKNILHYLKDVEHISRWQELFNNEVFKLSVKENVPIIDIRSAFLIKQKISDYLCDDGIHPNSNGHKLIFDSIMPIIQNNLCYNDSPIF